MTKPDYYYDYIKSDKWRQKATAAKIRSDWCCQVCNRHASEVKALDAHHRTYERLGDERRDDIIVLCSECHELNESQKKLKKPVAKEASFGLSSASTNYGTRSNASFPPNQDNNWLKDNNGLNGIIFFAMCLAALLGLITRISSNSQNQPMILTTEPELKSSLTVSINPTEPPTLIPTVEPTEIPMLGPAVRPTEMLGPVVRPTEMLGPVVRPTETLVAVLTSIPSCPYANRDSNLRAGPGTEYQVIGFAPNRACLPISGVSSSGRWYAFQDDVFKPHTYAWISTELVNDAPSNLPVVHTGTPSAPTPQNNIAQPVPSCPGGCVNQQPGCDIKGNVGFKSGELIYHVPGQEYYDATNIRPDYGERWFCTEEEAQAAGWRRAYN